MSQVYCLLYINIFFCKTYVLPLIQVKSLTVFFEMRFTIIRGLIPKKFFEIALLSSPAWPRSYQMSLSVLPVLS